MSSVDVYDDLDQIVAEHDLAYLHAKSVTDYWKADAKLIWRLDQIERPKTKTEQLVYWLMNAKRQNLEKFLNRSNDGED